MSAFTYSHFYRLVFAFLFQLDVFRSLRYPFEMWELNIYLAKTEGGAKIFKEWAKLNAGEDIQSFQDFVKIYAYFRKAQAAFGVSAIEQER